MPAAWIEHKSICQVVFDLTHGKERGHKRSNINLNTTIMPQLVANISSEKTQFFCHILRYKDYILSKAKNLFMHPVNSDQQVDQLKRQVF